MSNDNQNAGEQIARMSPEAAGLLVAAMESNHRYSEWAAEQVAAGLQADRDYWKNRALAAEERLENIRDHFDRILWG